MRMNRCPNNLAYVLEILLIFLFNFLFIKRIDFCKYLIFKEQVIDMYCIYNRPTVFQKFSPYS